MRGGNLTFFRPRGISKLKATTPMKESPVHWSGKIAKAALLIGLLGAGKFSLRWMRPEYARWALVPPVRVLERALGLEFIWVPRAGFWNQAQGILIDHSCVGSGFFLMLWVLGAWYFRWQGLKSVWIIGSGTLVVLVATLGVNGLRLLAVFGLSMRWEFLSHHRAQVHTVVGVLVFASALVAWNQFLTHLAARKHSP